MEGAAFINDAFEKAHDRSGAKCDPKGGECGGGFGGETGDGAFGFGAAFGEGRSIGSEDGGDG